MLGFQKRKKRQEQDRDENVAGVPKLKIRTYDPARIQEKKVARKAARDAKNALVTKTGGSVAVCVPNFQESSQQQLPASDRATENPPDHHDVSPMIQCYRPPQQSRGADSAADNGNVDSLGNSRELDIDLDNDTGLDGLALDDEPVGNVFASPGYGTDPMDINIPQATFHEEGHPPAPLLHMTPKPPTQASINREDDMVLDNDAGLDGLALDDEPVGDMFGTPKWHVMSNSVTSIGKNRSPTNSSQLDRSLAND